MLLPKINFRILLVLFLVFSNFWIYRILKENISAGVMLIIVTLLINVFRDRKDFLKVILVCSLILLLFQYKTTDTQDLTLLDNDEQRVQQERLRMYPPTFIDLGFKHIWLWPGLWIEQNSSVITISRIEKNLFVNLNLNKYFFGGTPRNIPDDFEKFTFFLMPFFLLGIYKIIAEKKSIILILLFVIPLTLMSMIGNKSNLGPASLFPFFIFTFVSGIESAEGYTNKKMFYWVLAALVISGFILQLNYAEI